MKFYLKINSQWHAPDLQMDSGGDGGIQLQWTFDNLISPIDYVGEYTYEFTLPFTQNNKKIFKHFEQLDSLTSTVSPNAFHPNVLIPYIIQTTNDVISTGEAYLSEVNDDGYVLALNGSLCTAFTKLLNSGWSRDKAGDDADYYLFDDLVDTVLDRNLVYSMWSNDQPSFAYDPTYQDISEILTVVPAHQGLYEEFESDKCLRRYRSGLLQTVQETSLFHDNDGNVVDCGDGLNEWQMQEFRSYEQNFGIYMQKLFQIYQTKCHEICGYELKLDSRWFNQTYEYLQNMVYVLGKLKHKEAEVTDLGEPAVTTTAQLPVRHDNGSELPGLSTYVNAQLQGNSITVIRGETVNYNMDFAISFNYTTTSTYWIFANWDNPLILTTDFVDENNVVRKSYRTAYHMLPNIITDGGDQYFDDSIISVHPDCPFYIVRYTPTPCTEGLSFTINTTCRFRSDIDATLTPVFSIKFYNDLVPFKTLSSWMSVNYNADCYTPINATGPVMSVTLNIEHSILPANRSGQAFTFERVFGDTVPFTILMKYTKMLGMLWIVDDYSKTITIKRRSDYFWDLIYTDNNMKDPHSDLYMGFYDITDLVDYESGFNITPLAWETQFVHLNYDDTDDTYTKNYKAKYKRSYGSALILTENYLNNDTENLLCTDEYDTIKPSCDVAPYYKPYSYYYPQRAGKFMCTTAPSAATDNNTPADISNEFYFRLRNIGLSNNMHMDGYKHDRTGNFATISDDTEFEIQNNSYCWHSMQYNFNSVLPFPVDKVVRSMPAYNTIRNGYSLHFAKPYEMYCPLPLMLRGDHIKYVFEQEWQLYTQEIYNVNNKTLEVDVAVNGELFRRLKSVPLVKIGDVAYLVTAIDGWDESQNLTKLKLRQIWNYPSLTMNNKSGSYTPTSSNNTVDGTTPEVLEPDVDVDIEEAEDIVYPMPTPSGDAEVFTPE